MLPAYHMETPFLRQIEGISGDINMNPPFLDSPPTPVEMAMDTLLIINYRVFQFSGWFLVSYAFSQTPSSCMSQYLQPRKSCSGSAAALNGTRVSRPHVSCVCPYKKPKVQRRHGSGGWGRRRTVLCRPHLEGLWSDLWRAACVHFYTQTFRSNEGDMKSKCPRVSTGTQLNWHFPEKTRIFRVSSGCSSPR